MDWFSLGGYTERVSRASAGAHHGSPEPLLPRPGFPAGFPCHKFGWIRCAPDDRQPEGSAGVGKLLRGAAGSLSLPAFPIIGEHSTWRCTMSLMAHVCTMGKVTTIIDSSYLQRIVGQFQTDPLPLSASPPLPKANRPAAKSASSSGSSGGSAATGCAKVSVKSIKASPSSGEAKAVPFYSCVDWPIWPL